MRYGFKNYDKWKLASPDDEAEEQEKHRLREEREIDRADEMWDREKDEMRREAEMERMMLHGND